MTNTQRVLIVQEREAILITSTFKAKNFHLRRVGFNLHLMSVRRNEWPDGKSREQIKEFSS